MDYVFGSACNQRLSRDSYSQWCGARQDHLRKGDAARVFTEFSIRTRASWSQSRRVVAKAVHQTKGESPRFVVTSV